MKSMETNEKTKLEEAGAFWIKTSKAGTQFLTGKIKSKSGEEINVMVFKNKYKEEGSKQPDYRIYFDNNAPKTDSVLKPEKVEKAIESSKKENSKPKETKTEEIPF
jgi:outer membrane protein assembly factor BamE (lipoprotein component of BamABCDE complex)